MSVQTYKALRAAHHEVVGVFTIPDDAKTGKADILGATAQVRVVQGGWGAISSFACACIHCRSRLSISMDLFSGPGDASLCLLVSREQADRRTERPSSSFPAGERAVRSFQKCSSSTNRSVPMSTFLHL